MITDYSLYLPEHLSKESTKKVFEELKDFPSNIGKKFYSFHLKKYADLLQGDGIKDIPFYHHELKETRQTNCMIISNSCDIDTNNRRKITNYFLYAPIANLSKYKGLLEKEEMNRDAIESHIKEIRKQKVSNILFLPKINSNFNESIVFFDRISHDKNNIVDRSKIEEKRLFSLSNFGFYLLLFKLSVHFSRMSEGIDRK